MVKCEFVKLPCNNDTTNAAVNRIGLSANITFLGDTRNRTCKEYWDHGCESFMRV